MILGAALGLEVWLDLAVLAHISRPAELARHYPEHAGQFYDRDSFDVMARGVAERYDRHQAYSARDGFMLHLNQLLATRLERPVRWSEQ